MVGRMGQMGRVGPIVLVGVLALLLGRLPTGQLPQVVKGDDALSVAFGDARAVIAQMMIRKSDSYYHGGVDVDCPLHGKVCDCHHEKREEGTGNREQGRTGWDPWKWINAHVRAPQRHVHLDGTQAVELMPFYWAALRADPHDVEAWTTAIFIASDHLKDDALAKRLIAEAGEKNPNSAEVAFAEGRYLRRNGNGNPDAARERFMRAERLLIQKGEANWTEDDRALSNLIKAFLGSAK